MSIVITGPSQASSELAITRIELRLTFYIRQLERQLRKSDLSGDLELELNDIKQQWNALVGSAFIPMLEREWLHAATVTYHQLQDAVDAAQLTASARSLLNVNVLHAATFLTAARKALQELGIDIWQRVKTALQDARVVNFTGPALVNAVTDAVSATLPTGREVVRTLMRAALVRGSLQQMMLSGVVCDKRWVTQHDEHVRSTHAEVDSQRVPLRATFEVGAYPMDGPHDPSAPSAEINNCRCTLDFVVESSQLAASAMTAAAMKHDGAMIALIPTDADLERLALDGGEPIEELHLTLFFLGQAADLPDDAMSTLTNAVEQRLADFPAAGPVRGRAFGVAYWNPTSDMSAWVLNVGDESNESIIKLGSVRRIVEEALGQSDGVEVPTQHCPWSPHVCLAYGAEFRDQLDAMLERVGPVAFDRIRIAIGDEVTDVSLESS